jgi:hypothetical protein
MTEKPIRRMTLQELLTHASKNIRDLAEKGRGSALPAVSDLRELTRLVRRRSRYPKMVAVQNSLNHLTEIQEQNLALSRELFEELKRIRVLARRDLEARGLPLLAQRESA